MNLIRTFLADRRSIPPWMVPLQWFNLCGIIIFLTVLLNGWLQNAVLAWPSWLASWLAGFIGTAAIGSESMQNLRLFGFLALARPRFYFELSRGSIAAMFLVFVPWMTCVFAQINFNIPLIKMMDIQRLLISFCGFLCLFFFASATCGYICSFVTSRKRRGHAYECTSFYYCFSGGCLLISMGYLAILDPPNRIQDAIVGGICCFFGAILMMNGVFAELTRSQHIDSKDAAEAPIRAS